MYVALFDPLQPFAAGRLSCSAACKRISEACSGSFGGPSYAPAPQIRKAATYLARFSYDVLPANRQKALDFVRREVEAARSDGLTARLLIPLTRAQGGAALQFEVALANLDQLDQFRQRGAGSSKETGDWMRAFSDILLSPPSVEILRVDESQSS